MTSDLHSIDGYMAAVIELFKSGKATDEQWQSMAKSVLHASEHDLLEVTVIDRTIFGACDYCNGPLYGGWCDMCDSVKQSTRHRHNHD